MCCDRVRSKRGPVTRVRDHFLPQHPHCAPLCTAAAVAVDMEAFEDLRRPRRTAQHHGMGQRLCARSPGAAVPAGADSVGCRPVLHGVQAPAPPRLRGAGGSDTRVPQPPRGASRRVRCAHLHACAAAACAAPPPALRRRGSAHRPRPWAPARGRHGVGRVPLCGRERAQPRADRGQLEQPPPDVAAERGRNLGPLVRGPAARGPGSAHVRAQLLRRRLLPHQVCVPCALVLAHVCAGADLGGTR